MLYVLSFSLQQVIVPAVILLLAQTIALLGPIIQQHFYGLNDVVKVLTYVVPDFVGFLLGYMGSKLPATFREPARHIWILPVVLFVIAYAASFIVDVHHILALLPIERASVADQYAIILLCFPCGACALYSIAIRAGDREVKVDHAALP
jgi:uncharacterized protein involved in cysteine biosynthesis